MEVDVKTSFRSDCWIKDISSKNTAKKKKLVMVSSGGIVLLLFYCPGAREKAKEEQLYLKIQWCGSPI